MSQGKVPPRSLVVGKASVLVEGVIFAELRWGWF